MLKVDTNLNHIPAGREHVVALFESINQPLVNIPGHGTAPTYASILGTRNDLGALMVFVYLAQHETGAVVVYVSEPRDLSREQYRAEEQEAVRFVESMGFMVDNIHFPTLPPHEQDAVMERSSLFRPPAPPVLPTPVSGGLSGGLNTDSMFGGLGAAESEVFQRAGVAAQSTVPADVVAGVPLAQGQPETAPQPKPLSTAAKARIGKLLGLFGVLFLLGGSLSACVTTRPDNKDAEAHNTRVDLGNQQLVQGQWRGALRTFLSVIEEDETHAEALRGLGFAYRNLDRLEEAERYYRGSVEAKPKWSIPKNELAVVLMERGACVEAAALLEQVLKDIFYPTPAYAEHNLARALACQGEPSKAIKRLEALVLKRPGFCLGYLTLAQVAADAKEHETTVRACEEFILNCEQNEKLRGQISPEHSAQCHLRRGLAHAQMGDIESARAAFEHCESKGPKGRECRRSLELLPQ